ncbi:MAG: aldehyde dehydrogenase, partial [Mesorhizobium sp.]
MEFFADRPAFFVNPDYRPMTGAAKPVIDPATLETVGAIAAAADGEIDAVLTAATKAQ